MLAGCLIQVLMCKLYHPLDHVDVIGQWLSVKSDSFYELLHTSQKVAFNTIQTGHSFYRPQYKMGLFAISCSYNHDEYQMLFQAVC